jgi:hypothetical protein
MSYGNVVITDDDERDMGTVMLSFPVPMIKYLYN